MSYREIIEIIFSFGLFINAASFIPQIIRIVREKSAKGVSLITFSIFLASQLTAVLYGLLIKSNILVLGYLLSMLTCAPVILLVLFYREHKHKLSEMETNIEGISFKDIIDQIPTHVYWKDIQGRYLGASNLQCVNTGFTRSSILGVTDYDLLPREQAEKIIAIDQKVLIEGVSIKCEEEADVLSGKNQRFLSYKIPLKDKKGDIVALLGISVDITEARKQEIENGEFLENIIALMPGHVYWKDKTGHYLGCNNNQAKTLGLSSRKEIVGLSVFDVYAKNDVRAEQASETRKIDNNDSKVILTGKAETVEEPLILKNGETIFFLSQKVPLYNSSGEITGLVGISVDLTEKKKAEQELIKAKEAAEAANRAKTEFLANMSHDVKTPLSGVIGMADLMIGDSVGQEKQRAEAIYACGMQLLAFFNSCLDLSKMEMAGWVSDEEIFSLEKMLQEIGALFSPSAQMKDLKLTVEVDPALPPAVRAHRASVYRVLLNLVGNALKFTPKGSVLVRGFLVDMLSPNQVRIGLEVKDTGIGIPADQQEIIFEKLRRLTPAYEGKVEGSGIGLYIVDQYVKRMGGKIQVESVVGQGSTFTVYLTMEVASEGELRAQEDIEGFSPSYAVRSVITPVEKKSVLPENVPRILLVEDNSLIQHVTQSLLNGAGFEVDVAGTGAEALEKFSPEKYRLIYMDIGLPDQDGYAVTQAIRAKESELNAVAVPIIALTAHGAVDVEAFCGRAGMQGVLSKPLTREQAEAVWEKFGLGKSEKVSGLTIVGDVEAAPLATKVIDMDGTVALLGSKEYAEELLGLWFEMLTKRFLPALKDLVEKRDDEGLRHELHNMLGSLCYVKTPLLNQAVLELQTAARNHPQGIEVAYQHVVAEAERFVAQYQQQFSPNKL